ncbi:type II secretion system protein N [Marinobacteraceae bacterium S3BR75-40.1]
MTSQANGFSLGKWRVFWLILLFLLTWLAAMIYALPASLVWSQASRYVQLPREVTVEAVGGSVWDGEALVKVAGRALRLDWQAGLPLWAEQQWPIAWSLETRQSRIAGEVTNLATEGLSVGIDEGRIDLAEFASLARANGLTLNGQITIDRLRLQLNAQGWKEATGVARWSGGPVAWNLPTGRGQATMPPMVARLETRGDALQAVVREESSSTPLITSRLQPTGWAHVEVHQRLLTLSGLQIGKGNPPDKVVFQVKQRLMPPVGS